MYKTSYLFMIPGMAKVYECTPSMSHTAPVLFQYLLNPNPL